MFRYFQIIIREFRRSLLNLLHIHDSVRFCKQENELNCEYVITLARSDETP